MQIIYSVIALFLCLSFLSLKKTMTCISIDRFSK